MFDGKFFHEEKSESTLFCHIAYNVLKVLNPKCDVYLPRHKQKNIEECKRKTKILNYFFNFWDFCSYFDFYILILYILNNTNDNNQFIFKVYIFDWINTGTKSFK